MTTPDALTTGSTPERASIINLIEQLQASCSRKMDGQWSAYLCAVCYGVVAALEGRQYFLVYCGVLTVVFLLQSASEKRTRKQIDLLVELVRELDKKS